MRQTGMSAPRFETVSYGCAGCPDRIAVQRLRINDGHFHLVLALRMGNAYPLTPQLKHGLDLTHWSESFNGLHCACKFYTHAHAPPGAVHSFCRNVANRPGAISPIVF